MEGDAGSGCADDGLPEKAEAERLCWGWSRLPKSEEGRPGWPWLVPPPDTPPLVGQRERWGTLQPQGEGRALAVAQAEGGGCSCSWNQDT